MTSALHVVDSDLSRDIVLTAVPASAELHERLQVADLIILPIQGQLGDPGAVFTQEVRELYRFLGKSAGALRVEVASESDSPPELVQHGFLIELGAFLVTQVGLPLLVGLLGSYVWQRIRDRAAPSEGTRVRCRIHVSTEHGDSKLLEFDGPASQFKSLSDVVEQLCLDQSRQKDDM